MPCGLNTATLKLLRIGGLDQTLVEDDDSVDEAHMPDEHLQELQEVCTIPIVAAGTTTLPRRVRRQRPWHQTEEAIVVATILPRGGNLSYPLSTLFGVRSGRPEVFQVALFPPSNRPKRSLARYVVSWPGDGGSGTDVGEGASASGPLTRGLESQFRRGLARLPYFLLGEGWCIGKPEMTYMCCHSV